jgi:hypothetical protein
MGGSPDFMFSMFPFFFAIIFLIVIGGFVFTLVRGVSQWSSNNAQPRLAVNARVVSRRTNVSHHHNMNNEHHFNSSSTTYYVTFEVESGDRMELHVKGTEYGMLAEGDEGSLSFQGTRYLGFERKPGLS